MRIRLLRRWRRWPVGQVLNVVHQIAEQLVKENKAEAYTGEIPPRKKMRVQLFKLR
jgi:hypothetical protein